MTLHLVALLAATSIGQTADAPRMVTPEVETADSVPHQIGLMLRCPVCQGMPIAESPAQMAQDMMALVRSMHEQGKTRQEIFDYFITRYGEWVLLKPKAEGFNLGLWILPIVALVVGVLLTARYVKKTQASDSKSKSPKASEEQQAAGSSTEADPYIDKVRRELDG